MLNKSFISLDGLQKFLDTVVVSSINSANSFADVPAGTIAKSYVTYYVTSGTTKVKANPQPTAGTSLAGNTYYILRAGSPDDITRAPSVSAMTEYVNTAVFGAMSSQY